MSRLLSSTAFRLAVASFVLFNLNLRSISSADTFPTRYLPIAILSGEGFHLDSFAFLRDARYPLPGGENDGLPYYLQLRRGHWVSTYPVMPAVLALPVYALPVALGLTRGPAVEPGRFSRTEVMGTLLSKIAASLATAISVALIFLALLRITDRRWALWGAIAYAVATSAWAVSSQGAWQTSYSGPLLLGAALLLMIARSDGGAVRHLVGAGACLAFAVACRPTTGIFAILLTAYAARHHTRHLVAFLSVPVVVGALLVAYNLYYFDSLVGGYTGPFVAKYDVSAAQMAVGTYGLLLSANRGLLTMSPVLLLPFVALLRALWRRDDSLEVHVAAGILLTVLFYSTFTAWYGTFSFSYRYLVDIVPFLMLFAAPAISWIRRSRRRLVFAGALALYSVGVQVVGAYFYPCGWYKSPLADPSALSRIFDWRDLEVVQCLRAGPVYPDGLQLIRPRATPVTERPDGE